MLDEFFINAMLLVAVTSILGHILKEIPENKVSTIYEKTIIGIFGGFTGILLLLHSIHISGTNTLIDLRAYAIMMASYFGGTIPALIAACITALYRVIYLGFTTSSLIAVLRLIPYLIFFYIIDKKVKKERDKWLYKAIFTLIVIILTDYYLLREIEKIQIILFEYALIHICVGFLEYFLLDYVRTSNELYRIYKNDSTKDFLTGLYNARQFDKLLNMAFKKVKQNQEKLSCIMVDIDHFKKINDTYGHAIGDLVLKDLAEILMKNSREIDIVSRVGGEEFCILLFNCDKSQTFEMALEINRAAKEHKFKIGENKFINITVSAGIAVYPETISNLDELKEKADNALYIAKRTGRNKVCINSKEI